MAAKTCFDCAHNLRIAVETGFAGSTSSWVSAPPTDRQRTAFVQYYAEGKTYQEIADAMGCTKQTVYESVQRALTLIRSFFKEN